MPESDTAPQVKIRRATERFCTRNEAEGKETWHSFSFGNHYDPEHIAFGPIMAINEERIAPGAGYEPHLHRDVDILTWVLNGTLAHEDSTGFGGEIKPGTLQHLNAGPGVTHSENNASATEPLVFVQMMLRADSSDSPAYGQVQIPSEPGLHAGPALSTGAQIFIARTSAEKRLEIPAADAHLIHVTRGTMRVAGSELSDGELKAGDAWMNRDPKAPQLTSPRDAEAIVWLISEDLTARHS